ncbi:MAG: LLM class F420-dependent oxidoreductase [Anaerolineae bacterium]
MAIPFGIFVPQGWRMDLVEIKDPVQQYEAMTRVALTAEESGYDSVWVYDHFHTVPEPTLETTFECWTITSGMARDTKRVRLGQMVTCNAYRNPALLAKMASTVDVMSHGRLIFGLGAGWYEHEWRAYGYGFPETPDRLRMLREGVQIIHSMWKQDMPEFQGKYYHIDRAINSPKGVQQPHIPLWIGGGGEKVTLKLVAQFGDACNVGGGDVETIKHKLAILREHCAAVGRNYDEITRSTSLNLHLLHPGEDPATATAQARGRQSYEEYARAYWVGTPDEIQARLETLLEAGINYIILYMPRVAYDPAPVRYFAESVMPHFK